MCDWHTLPPLIPQCTWVQVVGHAEDVCNLTVSGGEVPIVLSHTQTQARTWLLDENVRTLCALSATYIC